jgi:transglutaminase-like putative cysteine protease
MSGTIHYIGRKTYDQLVAEIIDLARQYASETASLPNNSGQMFELVRTIPYMPEKVETLKEPSVTLNDGGDCDDKTILFTAWAIARKLPCRVTLAGLKTEPGIYHHIFPEMYINGKWIPYDATYSYGKIGKTLAVYDNFKSYQVAK